MLWLAALGLPTIQKIIPRLTTHTTNVHRITKHLGTILHFYKKRKQPSFHMTEHKQIGQTPMHTCSCTQENKPNTCCLDLAMKQQLCAWPHKTDHAVKLSLYNTSHVVTFLSHCKLLATKHIKRKQSHKPQQLTVQHAPSHISHLGNQVATTQSRKLLLPFHLLGGVSLLSFS